MTRSVCTLTTSGIGVSEEGCLAQLEIASIVLNLRSEKGLCRPIVALNKIICLLVNDNTLYEAEK